MGFTVVSESNLLREMMASYCVGNGFEVRGLFERLSDIPDNWPDQNVVVYLSNAPAAANFGLMEFQARFEKARIVVLVPATVSDEVLADLTPRVDALIMDDRSLQTLTGVLTLVQEGFNISPGSVAFQTPHLQSAQPRGTVAIPVPQVAGVETAPTPLRTLVRSAETQEPDCLAKLSPREREVLRRLRDGQSNKDIAKHLDIVESTVKVHLRGCFRKIGAQNRTQAAVWAAQHLPD